MNDPIDRGSVLIDALHHFVLAALKDQPITIYGDGKQVRDVLNVSDLLRADGVQRLVAWARRENTAEAAKA